MDEQNITREAEDGAAPAEAASAGAARQFDPRTAFVRESGRGREHGYSLIAADAEHRGLHLLATGMEKHYADDLARILLLHEEMADALATAVRCMAGAGMYSRGGSDRETFLEVKAVLHKARRTA